jgi:peroxiredoxin
VTSFPGDVPRHDRRRPGRAHDDDLFSGKKVVLFAVPGAFTPTCHRNHLPGYLEKAAEIKAKGVDAIMVTGVNDVFVMDAWSKATGGAGVIEFLSDGNADFAKEIGLSLDGSGFGLGTRSQRYSMLVEDGVVKVLSVEEAAGKAEASGARRCSASSEPEGTETDWSPRSRCAGFFWPATRQSAWRGAISQLRYGGQKARRFVRLAGHPVSD